MVGKAFEHFIAMEIRAFLSYHRIRKPLAYWRSTSQFEVDFIIGRDLAVEVKASELVHDRMLKGLRALREEKLIKNYVVASFDHRRRRIDGIDILPWPEFLDKLWNGHWVY